MDSKTTQQKEGDTQEPSSKADELQKTPVRPGRGAKRKYQSPGTPATATSRQDDVEKPSPAKRRRKSTSAGGIPLSRVGSPGSLLKPALTERQQMALLMQMTDPQKQEQQQAPPVEETPPRVETTPRSRVSRRNERGETPLHTACIKGDLKMVLSLIEQGAEVNATDHAGWMPLHEASNYGYNQIVTVLLNNGANVNAHGLYGDTPLHDAAVNSHLQTVKLLLEFGADPNLANDKGITSVDICEDNQVLKLLTAIGDKMESEELRGEEEEEGEEEEKGEEGHIGSGKEEEKCPDDGIKTAGESPPPLSSPKTETDASDMDTDPVSRKAKQQGTSSVVLPKSESLMIPLGSSTQSTVVGGKGARGGFGGRRKKGKFYGDISSSESESDYFDIASKRTGRRRKGLLVERRTRQSLEGVSESQEETDEDVEAGRSVVVEEEGVVEVKGRAAEVKGVEEEERDGKKDVKADRREAVAVEGSGEEEEEERQEIQQSTTGQETELQLELGKPEEPENLSAEETTTGHVPERQNSGIVQEARQDVVGSPPRSPGSTPEKADKQMFPTTPASPEQQEKQGGKQKEEGMQQEQWEEGKQQQEDGKQQHKEAKQQLEDGKQQHKQQLEDGKQQQKEQQKEDKRQQEDGIQQLEDGKQQLDDEKQQQQQDLRKIRLQASPEGMRASPLPPSVRSPESERSLPQPDTSESRKPPKRDSETDSDVDVDTTSSSPSHMLQPLPPSLPTSTLLPSLPRTSEHEKPGFVVSIPLSMVTVTCSEGSRSVSEPSEETSGMAEKVKVQMQTRSTTRDASVPQKSEGSSIPRESTVTTRTLEKRDVYSSLQEARQPTFGRNGASGDKQHHTKHSRKPQHVYSSKKIFKEGRREGDRSQLECRETMEDSAMQEDDTISFSVSVDWGVLGSQPMKAGGTRPGSSHGRRKEDSGCHRSKANANESEEEKTDDSDTSKSTIVSLPTSLPIIFSRYSGGHLPSVLKQQDLPPSSGAGWINKDTLVTPPSYKPKTLPILMESVKSTFVAQRKGGSQPTSSAVATDTKDTAQQDSEDDVPSIPLPPKKRYRGVQRSAVVQQRREGQGPPPSLPAQFSSFLMCTGDYRSKRPPQPTIPKSVYPPIHSAMYKLFSEQEGERVRLAAALLAEQDRLVLSMEQELIRAHQRATKSHSPVSVCAVLLERLLPRSNEPPPPWEQKTEESPTSKHPDPALDPRLLAGLVQDVWDKFYKLKLSLLTRQRHETEALWMVQLGQWVERLGELGFKKPSALCDVPPSHVPVSTSLFKGMNTNC